MIYLIDYEDFEPPEDWLQKAQAVTDELCEMEDAEERKKLINRKSDLWGELKNRLYQISHGKCWYCGNRSDCSMGRSRGVGQGACDATGRSTILCT